MMEAEPKRTLAYLCPACGQSVAVERTAFQLAASANELPCPCGKSALRVELEGVRARLTVPCLFCGTEHTVTCPAEALLNERVLAFSCAASGLDCCYVGEEGPVFAALKRLEEAADKLDPGNRGAGTFLDELVMHEVLSELREIAQRDGVSCTCGSHQWKPLTSSAPSAAGPCASRRPPPATSTISAAKPSCSFGEVKYNDRF